MTGSRADLLARLKLCDETAAHPERHGPRNLFLRALLAVVAKDTARKIHRELERRDARRKR